MEKKRPKVWRAFTETGILVYGSPIILDRDYYMWFDYPQVLDNGMEDLRTAIVKINPDSLEELDEDLYELFEGED